VAQARGPIVGAVAVRRLRTFAAVAGALALLAIPAAAQGANGNANYHAVCPGPPAGFAHCHALVVTDGHGNPQSGASPSGLSPATIDSVYGLPGGSTAGAGKTIAIVDAYDDPTAAGDLSTFSSQYGLPACTTANGCFSKVNQTGGTSYPSSNSGWALEISLDIEWAHAIAPGAKILLVEASSNSFTNLLAAEDYAGQHAQYVSNSWGGSEFSGETGYDSHFSQSGVSFFVSAGDSGLPAEYPSTSPNVISVGGTTLHFSGSSFTGETGWSSGGGGCSSYETATSAQSAFSGYGQVSCGGKRATPDVSLDADPNSGVSVYDSTPYSGQTGWFTVGGTSASSPMWAGASADASAQVNSAYVYGNSITYRDITQGNNGAACLTGYDLCTGRGSWLYGASSPPPTTTLSISGGGGQTITAGSQSAPITVSVSPAQSSDVTVTLASTSSTGTFTPASVTIPAGSSGTFTYKDSTPGTWTLTAAASGATSATTTITVTSSSSSAMAVNLTAGTVSQKGPNYRVPLTATATDSASHAPLSGATVTLAVYGSTCSGSVVASGTGTTDANGTAGFTFSTRTTGSWCALATATATGYSAGTSNAAIFSTPQ
jgi:subtilase family serine protease